MTNNENNVGWNFNNSYAKLPEIFYTKLKPVSVKKPELVVLNKPLAKDLGLNLNELSQDELAEIFSGNLLPENSEPLAQAYAGHQFGYFTMLGDGRAVLLGEQKTPSGKIYDIQLKGSGRTPYSRGGDGRAAIGPMLREYIISEAMYALGIPTTRSLAVVLTGENVYRENILKGAILTRIALSHLRVGTFEYALNYGSQEDLQLLADYAIEKHYPHLEKEQDKYVLMLKEIIKNQANLISKWMLVGFIHGVMNTDNMTISGETIDYGPCAFMESYSVNTVFSSIDTNGRYAYGNQPKIGEWNLTRLASAMLPLFSHDKEKSVELAKYELSQYEATYKKSYYEGMMAKLGLFNINEEMEDEKLIDSLLNIMQKNGLDYTNTFVNLTYGNHDAKISESQDFKEWLNLWEERRQKQNESREESNDLMKKFNPVVIPRNHRVEEALKAAENGDLSVIEKLHSVLLKPFDYSIDNEEYRKLPPPTSCGYKTFCGT